MNRLRHGFVATHKGWQQLEVVSKKRERNKHSKESSLKTIDPKQAAEASASIGLSQRDIEAVIQQNGLQTYDNADILIIEAIRTVIADYGAVSRGKLKKLLNQIEYGPHKVGFFQLHRLLKLGNLETKQKRQRYYRSC